MVPVLLAVMAMMLQPLCLFYCRTVMAQAAAEGARVMATKGPATTNDEVAAFVRRRLAAVPDASVFHDGGNGDWDVEVESGDDGRRAVVRVKGKATPLPLVGAFSAALAGADGKVALSVEACEQVRPGWVEGSYGSWQSIWS